MKTFVTVFCALLLSATAYAQTTGISKQDEAEIREYRLTLTAFKQIAQAMESMLEKMKSATQNARAMKIEAELQALGKKEEPTEAELARMEKLAEELEALEDANDIGLNKAKTLDEFEAAVRRSPELSAALKSVGMVPRDYGKFMLAYLQAAFVQGFMKSGHLKEMPKEVNPENVKFLAENEAAIVALFKKLEGSRPPK